jgi:quercetin dioxygenase-like cupin family protein
MRYVPLALLVPCLAALAGCAAHDHGMTAKPGSSPAGTPHAFVRTLPETHEYFRMLAAPESVALHSGLVTLEPGANCGQHSTEDHEELVICLAGAGEIEVQGRGRTVLAAGQYAYNPPHATHNIFNTGSQAMRYIYVVTRVGPQTTPAQH